MKENEEKQQRQTGELRYVDRSTLQTQELNQNSAIELVNPSIQELLLQLRQGVCTLFFYKITNGMFRRMRCTLQNVEPVPSKYNRQGVVVVWDLDASQWRSFYPNRVFKLIRNEKTDIQ
jgi:transposase